MISADELRLLLCDLGVEIRGEVERQRNQRTVDELAAVVGAVTADVTYEIDRVTEHRVLEWFARAWPVGEPVRIVMEGIEDDRLVCFPPDGEPGDTRWVCIIDPIDGTRNLMFDKRSGWALSAVAPATPDESGWPSARLADIVAAAMTELPTTRQWRADQLSAVAGCGPAGVVATGTDLRAPDAADIQLVIGPTSATTVAHGFASFADYLPDGKAWLADIEQRLWDAVWPPDGTPRPIFEDQFMCSAGQLAEVMCGRDRIVGDLRPFAYDSLDISSAMSCHPYDICTSLVLTELGGLFENPLGGPVDCPLDTTTPVAWVAYANESLAELIRAPLAELLRGTVDR